MELATPNMKNPMLTISKSGVGTARNLWHQNVQKKSDHRHMDLRKALSISTHDLVSFRPLQPFYGA